MPKMGLFLFVSFFWPSRFAMQWHACLETGMSGHLLGEFEDEILNPHISPLVCSGAVQLSVASGLRPA